MLEPGSRELLDRHIMDTFFYHYDGWESDPLDEHSGHPILSKHSSVLLNLDRHGEFVIDHLKSLDICAGEILHVETESRMDDSELKKRLQQLRLGNIQSRTRFSNFYSVHEEDFLDKSKPVGGISLRVAPRFEKFEKWNSKSHSLAAFAKLGVNSPRAISISRAEDAIDFIEEFASCEFIVKQADQVPCVISSYSELESIWQDWQNSIYPTPLSEVTLELRINVGSVFRSPNLTWLVPSEETAPPVFLFATDQIMENGTVSHIGNIMPSQLSSELIEKCKEAAEAILCDLRGIDSVIGIDYVIDDKDNVFVVDVNPRFNSCSFPGDAFSRLNHAGEEKIAVYKKIGIPDSSFFSLSDFVQEIETKIQLYSTDTRKGLILFGPIGVGFVSAFRVMAIGQDLEECDSFIDNLMHEIEIISIGGEPKSESVLLEPLTFVRGLRRKTLKNRVIVPAHSYNLSDVDGSPKLNEFTSYVGARISGGAGMVVLGETLVPDPIFFGEQNWGASIISERSFDTYRQIMKLAHAQGCLVVEQLCHTGGQFGAELDGATGDFAYAPSPVMHKSFGAVPREMTIGEIRSVISYYVEAARLVKLAGLDGIEIKADQGKLPHQFLSPLYNHRTDEFGPEGAEGRFKFLHEVLREVRNAIDDDLLLGVRLPCDTNEPGDLDYEQSLEHILRCVGTGLVDYISINGATNSTPQGYLLSHGDETVPRMTFAEKSRSIRQEVRNIADLPIFLATRIVNQKDAEEVIRTGAADVVAMARAHIADPDFMNKVISKSGHRIRECIGCSQSCVGNTWEGRTVACIYNPEAGHETEVPSGTLFSIGSENHVLAQIAVQNYRENWNGDGPHIAVVGGGPAGLEVVRTALQAGAQVTLFESSAQLGGSVRTWSQMDSRAGYAKICDWLEREIEIFGSEGKFIRKMETTAGALDLLSCNADYIFIATGGRTKSDFYGRSAEIHASHFSLDDFVENADAEATVLVAAESWLQGGLHIAYELSAKGYKVEIVSSGAIGLGLDFVTHTSIMGKLRSSDLVSFYDYSGVIRNKGEKNWAIHDLLSGKISKSKAEFLIHCDGLIPNNSLSQDLSRIGLSHHVVGDANKFGGIELAIRDARIKTCRALEVELRTKQQSRSKDAVR